MLQQPGFGEARAQKKVGAMGEQIGASATLQGRADEPSGLNVRSHCSGVTKSVGCGNKQ